ncbi:hypothetical protein [Glycomyces sp. NPDC047010]|uniref:CdiA C-terminal domain-containing protein n=1 Tax=Glycomyces sp. NPDC047010 TaxID=3155023 RepID=UPI0033F4E94D
MSLLSELIAQLNALSEQNREAQAELSSAHDQIEGALGQVRDATIDSSNPLVAEGIGQWQAGLDKLDEARALMAAGDQSMSAYIAGPLLGGGSRSGGGNPPGAPPTAAPPPAPEPSHGDVTRPRFAPDPDRRPSGPPTELQGTASNKEDLRRENEAAKVLAEAGYDIEQNPATTSSGKNPDYLIQGEIWDCYSPRGSSTRTIHTAIREKVGRGGEDQQADRIVLNLDASGASPAEIRARLERSPIRRLREIKIVKGGKVTQFYPWDSEVDSDGD